MIMRANLQSSKWANISNHGGGAAIFLANGSIGNVFWISHCNYFNNRAHFGAGLFIKCHSLCRENNITFFKANFHGNVAKYGGGGGMDIGYSVQKKHHQEISPINNVIVFNSCSIADNTGIFGGGVASFSDLAHTLPVEDNKQNEIVFQNCSFTNNRANGGAAVDINIARKTTGYFFISLHFFDSCNFSYNIAGNSSSTSSNITQSGAFFTSRITACFSGNIHFEQNRGTALYASLTTIYFKNAKVNFSGNTGGISGGILLVGQAYLDIEGISNFTFVNNSGTFGGGLSSLILENALLLFY